MSKRWVGFWVLTLTVAIAGIAGARPKPKTAPSPTTAVKPLQVAKPTSTPIPRKSVEVLWGGSWWPGEVLEAKDGLTKIHYTGWGSEWDEWVDATRLRSSFHPPLKNPRPGQKIEVEWHGSWWPAEIAETRSGFFKIHYSGWGSEWDEWIEQNRMRSAPTR